MGAQCALRKRWVPLAQKVALIAQRRTVLLHGIGVSPASLPQAACLGWGKAIKGLAIYASIEFPCFIPARAVLWRSGLAGLAGRSLAIFHICRGGTGAHCAGTQNQSVGRLGRKSGGCHAAARGGFQLDAGGSSGNGGYRQGACKLALVRSGARYEMGRQPPVQQCGR